MLKIPFIEKTYIGVELASEYLYWVELNKFSNKVEVIGFGEMPVLESLDVSLNELKNQIKSDAYYLGCADKQILDNQIVTETPFFEDEGDLQKWLKSQHEELEKENKTAIISSHIIRLGEEESRLVTQVINAVQVEQLLSDFKESHQPLLYLSSGVIELGYSLILNPDFIESFTGVISKSKEGNVLQLFDQGRFYNNYELPDYEDIESIMMSADSILKSEELTLELAENSIPCYYQSETIIDYQTNRSLYQVEAYFNKGRAILPTSYAAAAGVAIKMCYPELDDFEVITTSEKERAWFNYDKTEFIRTIVLLFVPLIVFLLIAFAIDKWTEPQLNEVSQISALVGDKLDIVTTEREAVSELRADFENLSSEFAEHFIAAPLFEVIATSIPESIVLEELIMEVDDQSVITQLDGFSNTSDLITQFIQSILGHERISSVELLSSEFQLLDYINQEQIYFSIEIHSYK